jgi:ankyrin repeat protein
MANLWLTAVSLPMQKGRTALHFSAAQGHELVVEILLDAGADREIQDQVNTFDLFAQTCV